MRQERIVRGSGGWIREFGTFRVEFGSPAGTGAEAMPDKDMNTNGC